MQITAEIMQTYDLLKFAAAPSNGYTLLITQHEVLFINTKEATQRPSDPTENGKCTNVMNRRSRVGLSISFCITKPLGWANIWYMRLLPYPEGNTTLIHLFHLEEILVQLLAPVLTWIHYEQRRSNQPKLSLAHLLESAVILVVFTHLIVRLSNQNFAATSNCRNEPIGVFIAGVLLPPLPPPYSSVFCPNSFPPPLPPPLHTPAMQAMLKCALQQKFLDQEYYLYDA